LRPGVRSRTQQPQPDLLTCQKHCHPSIQRLLNLTVPSQRIRKRIEEAIGWIKTVAGQERTKFRGRERVGWAFSSEHPECVARHEMALHVESVVDGGVNGQEALSYYR
jgi:hypothetical protein